jgi:hypothetical protein
MERVYMIPEKDFKRKLQLPTSNTPMNALGTALQDLNAQPNLSDAARWKEYERIFNSYLAFSKKPWSNPRQQQLEEEDVLSKDVFQPLFAGEDKDTVDRVIAPVYHTLPKNLKDKGLQLLQFIAQTQDYSTDARCAEWNISNQSRWTYTASWTRNSRIQSFGLDSLRCSSKEENSGNTNRMEDICGLFTEEQCTQGVTSLTSSSSPSSITTEDLGVIVNG